MMSGVVGAIAAASLLQQPASTLSVRVVDAHRSPLPGISVRVAEAGNCLTPEANSLPQLLAVTRVDGSVEFSVASDRVYVVTVEAQGGLEGRRDCLDRVPRGPVYSQIELRPDLSQQVTLIQPAVEAGPASGTLGLGEFVGVYTDGAGLFYEVSVLDGAEGVALSSPGGGVSRFPERRGSTFRGPDGTLNFSVERGRVTGFSVTRPTVKARKRT